MKNFTSVLFSNKSLFILSIIFIVSFCTLPYFLPPKEMVESMSYDYGFNNQMGVLLVGLSIVIFGIGGFFRQSSHFPLFIENTRKVLREHLFVGYVIYIISVIFALFAGDEFYHFHDNSSFFLLYVAKMAYGEIPYIDFAFGYGPLMLYLPYWLYLIIPNISLVSAYILSLAFFHSIGLYALYELINAINIGRRERIWMFWVGFLLLFPYTCGMNCVAFRFVFPFWAMWRCHQCHSLWKMLLFPFSVVVTLAFSPEIGLIHLFTAIIYCALQYYVDRNKQNIVTIVITILLSALFVIAFLPMFTGALSFKSGYNNLPFFPEYYLMVFFICIFVMAYFVGTKIFDISHNVFEISFSILAFGLIPACLGRCDDWHVIYNGFFILCMAFVIIWKTYKFLKVYLICIYVLLIVPFLLVQFDYFKIGYIFSPINNKIGYIYNHKEFFKNLSSIVNLSDVVENKIDTFYKLYGNSTFTPPINEDILLNKKISMPIMSHAEVEDYVWLTSNGFVVDVYYSNSIGTAHIWDTIKELEDKNIDLLLLPEKWQEIVEPNSNRYHSWFNDILKPYRNGNMVNKPFVDYIQQNYKKRWTGKKYVLYERKSTDASLRSL